MKYLLACLVAAGCGGGTTMELTLTGAAFSSSSRVVVDLYGYEEFIADAPATLLDSIDVPASGSGAATAKVSVELPENPHELIDQGHGPVPAAEALFYVRVFVDHDGDGTLCPGDFREEGSAFTSFRTMPAELTVFLAEIPAGTTCL